MSGRDPAEIIELLLAPEWCPGIEIGPIDIGAFVAHDLGFISLRERDDLVDQARVRTQERMRNFHDAVPSGRVELRRRLTRAMSSPAEFSQIVAGAAYQRAVHSFRPEQFFEVRVRLAWPHPIVSLADKIDNGLAGPRLQWLTVYLLRRYNRVLTLAMDGAWRRALKGYRSTTATTLDGL